MFKKILSLLLLCALAFGWENIGMGGGGGQHAPALSPHDLNLMFVSCDMSGFYRTEDGGKSWKMFDTRKISNTNTYEVYFHPTDPNIIFTESKQGFQVSYDKGLNWQVFVEAPLWKGKIKKMLISKKDNSIILVAPGAEVWESRDTGKSWIKNTELADIKDFFQVGKYIYAATAAGVSRSQDGGLTWKDKNTVCPKAPLQVFAVRITERNLSSMRW
ncbi:MAG: hypothetical protein WCK36_03310 [Candidatus Firestonebacteria bacterium]